MRIGVRRGKAIKALEAIESSLQDSTEVARNQDGDRGSRGIDEDLNLSQTFLSFKSVEAKAL